MRASVLACVALVSAAAVPAAAQVRADPYQHAAIAAGDYAAAEARLRAEQRVYPAKPEVLLNLAAVLARTGRADGARALYRQVLAGDDVSLRLADDRSASAHAIARRGLALADMPTPLRFSER